VLSKRHFKNLWRSTKELGLGGVLGEEHSLISKDWSCDGTEITRRDLRMALEKVRR